MTPFRLRVHFKEPDDVLQLTIYDDFLIDMYKHAPGRIVDVVSAEYLFNSSDSVLSYISRIFTGNPVTLIPHAFPRIN